MAFPTKSKPIGPVKKGALHAQMGVPQGEKIGKPALEAAKNSGDPVKAKRANFALNMAYSGGGKVLPGWLHVSKAAKDPK